MNGSASFRWILFTLLIFLAHGKFKISISDEEGEEKVNNKLELELRRRHFILKQVALTARSNPETHSPPHCPINRITFPDRKSYGQTGNIMITLVHALWLGRKVNATVILAGWMDPIFAPFNTSLIRSIYCITADHTIPPNAKVISVRASDAFFGFQLKNHLPEEYDRYFTYDWKEPSQSPLVLELSRHFLQVYASLWCCPVEEIFQFTKILIRSFFGHSLSYTAIHKRSFEGDCSEIYNAGNGLEFSRDEIPLNHVDWQNFTRDGDHPFCTLTPAFVRSTFAINHRSPDLSNTFIATDGQSDITAFLKLGSVTSMSFQAIYSSLVTGEAINSTDLSYYPNLDLEYLKGIIDKDNKPLLTSYYAKYIDMLMLMHAEFSLLQPYSTYSFQVFVIRIALGLQSVPYVQHNDIYQQSEAIRKKQNRPIWISPLSILKASVTF